DGLPHAPLANRADGIKKTRSRALSVNQGAVRRNIQTQKQWIRPRQFLPHEIRQQRIVHLAAITFGTGAVDHTVDAQLLKSPGYAVAVIHVDTVHIFGVPLDATRMDLDLAMLNLRREPGTDRGRDAMTMHIPVGAHVAQEPASLFEREGTPDFLRERTKGVDDG